MAVSYSNGVVTVAIFIKQNGVSYSLGKTGFNGTNDGYDIEENQRVGSDISWSLNEIRSNPSMAENVKVICRVRPLNASEISKKSSSIITFPGKNSVGIGGKTYTFDGVLLQDSTQDEVYTTAGMEVVENVISGYNGTVFAYGQTSSGKTHTMIGKPNDDKLKGLIPRIVHATFEHIRKLTENLSFLIKGATERYVSTPEEVFDALEEGRTNKKTAATAMNMDSSRSHTIFCFYISQEDNITKKKLYSRLYLVDLAGSEKVSKTAAEGQTLEEAKNINKSLSALGNVINALVEGANHVPYRDSKLTRMLQESLGGNAKTTMLICVSPASYNEAETKSTILFGSRVKTIKNVVMVNVELSTEEWKKQYMDLRTKYKALLEQNAELETEIKRWRAGEKVPQGDWIKEYTDKLKEDPIIKDMAGQAETIAIKKAVKVSDGVDKDLYKDLDVKDEEIALVTQNLRKIEKELSTVNDQVLKLSKEKEELIKTNAKLQADFDRVNKDLRDVLPALEEMAASLAQKTKDLDQKRKDSDKLQDIYDQLQKQFQASTNQINSLKDGEIALRKLLIDILREMKSDLSVIASVMNESIKTPSDSLTNKLEEEINGIKIFITKIKGETKNFLSKSREGLLGKEAEPYKKIEILEKQIEINKKNAEERLLIILNEKRKSEAQLYQLKRENITKSTDGKIGVIKDSKTIEKIQNQVKHVIDTYTNDLDEAKQDIIDRTKENQELKDKLDLALSEIEILHQSGLGLDTKKQIDRREQTKNELKGLEENVNREILTLNTLRKIFLNDLRTRVKKISQKSSIKEILSNDEDEFLTVEKLNPHQRERMLFLETNLENLTKVHKKLVRDNADLRSDLPKMERRLKASAERIKNLEQALKEAKEMAVKERRKYQSEVDRIKETIRSRNMSMRVLIAKPIQAGGAVPTVL